MSSLLFFDQQLFLLINHLPHNELLDAVALMISGVGSLGAIWFFPGGLLFLKEERKDNWFFLPLIIAGSVSWALVELILKPLVARPRPDGSGGFSFPSGHATIAFACAIVLSKKEPRLRWLWFTLATLISLSRVYLGKHFPLDILAGASIGFIIGVLTSSRKMFYAGER